MLFIILCVIIGAIQSQAQVFPDQSEQYISGFVSTFLSKNVNSLTAKNCIISAQDSILNAHVKVAIADVITDGAQYIKGAYELAIIAKELKGKLQPLNASNMNWCKFLVSDVTTIQDWITPFVQDRQAFDVMAQTNTTKHLADIELVKKQINQFKTNWFVLGKAAAEILMDVIGHVPAPPPEKNCAYDAKTNSCSGACGYPNWTCQLTGPNYCTCYQATVFDK